uniref:Uncharacterized protein n=2 Tax=Mucochytrium quahogii TaxID=96639 RepID=A0A7S2W8K0_9STRA|mmetsp:Transcript_16365/g.35669  ORF Transcript_16365/g.35669 Transcript_16365/m.35669 type:complete len:1230 (+) Transcript_16365:379-4068(+)
MMKQDDVCCLTNNSEKRGRVGPQLPDYWVGCVRKVLPRNRYRLNLLLEKRPGIYVATNIEFVEKADDCFNLTECNYVNKQDSEYRIDRDLADLHIEDKVGSKGYGPLVRKVRQYMLKHLANDENSEDDDPPAPPPQISVTAPRKDRSINLSGSPTDNNTKNSTDATKSDDDISVTTSVTPTSDGTRARPNASDASVVSSVGDEDEDGDDDSDDDDSSYVMGDAANYIRVGNYYQSDIPEYLGPESPPDDYITDHVVVKNLPDICSVLPKEDIVISPPWTPTDRHAFEKALYTHGANFRIIADELNKRPPKGKKPGRKKKIKEEPEEPSIFMDPAFKQQREKDEPILGASEGAIGDPMARTPNMCTQYFYDQFRVTRAYEAWRKHDENRHLEMERELLEQERLEAKEARKQRRIAAEKAKAKRLQKQQRQKPGNMKAKPKRRGRPPKKKPVSSDEDEEDMDDFEDDFEEEESPKRRRGRKKKKKKMKAKAKQHHLLDVRRRGASLSFVKPIAREEKPWCYASQEYMPARSSDIPEEDLIEHIAATVKKEDEKAESVEKEKVESEEEKLVAAREIETENMRREDKLATIKETQEGSVGKPQETNEAEVEPNDPNRYCVCNGSEIGFMVLCASCDKWFHTACVGLRKDMLADGSIFTCAACAPKRKELYDIPTPELLRPASWKLKPQRGEAPYVMVLAIGDLHVHQALNPAEEGVGLDGFAIECNETKPVDDYDPPSGPKCPILGTTIKDTGDGSSESEKNNSSRRRRDDSDGDDSDQDDSDGDGSQETLPDGQIAVLDSVPYGRNYILLLSTRKVPVWNSQKKQLFGGQAAPNVYQLEAMMRANKQIQPWHGAIRRNCIHPVYIQRKEEKRNQKARIRSERLDGDREISAGARDRKRRRLVGARTRDYSLQVQPVRTPVEIRQLAKDRVSEFISMLPHASFHYARNEKLAETKAERIAASKAAAKAVQQRKIEARKKKQQEDALGKKQRRKEVKEAMAMQKLLEKQALADRKGKTRKQSKKKDDDADSEKVEPKKKKKKTKQNDADVAEVVVNPTTSAAQQDQNDLQETYKQQLVKEQQMQQQQQQHQQVKTEHPQYNKYKVPQQQVQQQQQQKKFAAPKQQATASAPAGSWAKRTSNVFDPKSSDIDVGMEKFSAKEKKNERERRRRLQVSHGFTDLFKILKMPENTKMEKSTVLNTAIERLTDLQLENKGLLKENHSLRMQAKNVGIKV